MNFNTNLSNCTIVSRLSCTIVWSHWTIAASRYFAMSSSWYYSQLEVQLSCHFCRGTSGGITGPLLHEAFFTKSSSWYFSGIRVRFSHHGRRLFGERLQTKRQMLSIQFNASMGNVHGFIRIWIHEPIPMFLWDTYGYNETIGMWPCPLECVSIPCKFLFEFRKDALVTSI